MTDLSARRSTGFILFLRQYLEKTLFSSRIEVEPITSDPHAPASFTT